MRNTLLGSVICATLFFSLPMQGQTTRPSNPVTHIWTVSGCDSWKCTLSALVDGDGDHYTFALPVRSDDHSWLVIKRFTGDAFYQPPGELKIESFDSVGPAVARYAAGDPERTMMVCAPDGTTLVVSGITPRRRAIKP